jgi:hypothetical protein
VDQFVQHHSEGEDVAGEAVTVVKQHLRRHIYWGADVDFGLFTGLPELELNITAR